MKNLRSFISNKIFIHFLAALGIFSLWGYIETANSYILLGMVMSFMGAVCGSFIRIINEIRNKSH